MHSTYELYVNGMIRIFLIYYFCVTLDDWIRINYF